MDNGYNQYQNVNYNPYMGQQIYVQPSKKKFITVSMILGLIGSVMLSIGLMLPAVDFSHFHQDVDIQYNLFKVGKNVGLISPMWNVIPYAILAGIILMIILSFIKIPILKILPALLILCMFILMLADMGNLAKWANDLMETLDINLEVGISTGEIIRSLMPGVYVMVIGLVVTIVSCFVTIKDN